MIRTRTTRAPSDADRSTQGKGRRLTAPLINDRRVGEGRGLNSARLAVLESVAELAAQGGERIAVFVQPGSWLTEEPSGTVSASQV